jgi:hypothetical protein
MELVTTADRGREGQEGPVEIDRHHAPPVLERLLGDLAAAADPGVDDRVVELACGALESAPELRIGHIVDMDVYGA